jgi:hypothetical protein
MLLAAAAALTLAAQPASAVVLTFDHLAHEGSASTYYSSGFEYGGFRFRNSLGDTTTFRVFGSADPRNADPDGATFTSNWGPAFTVMERIDGGTFDLLSLDFADYANDGTSTRLELLYDGQYQSLSLDSLAGLETLTLNLRGVRSFQYAFSGGAPWGQVDNIVVDEPIVSGVPEPATWAMMILGFAGVGAALRRRNCTAAAAI